MTDENSADVLEQDGPEENNAEELANAKPEGGEADPQANANEHDDETGQKRLGGWQRKIRKLEQEKETLLELLRSGGKQDAKPAQETAEADDKPPVKPVRPKQSDFKTWEEFEAARDKYDDDRDSYHEKNLAYQLRQEGAKRQQESQQQTVADVWAQKCAEAKSDPEMADFEKVAFSPEVPMSAAMMDAIVDSEFGAYIAYELGKNPDEAERIASLPPIAAIREIGKIESRIAGKQSAAENSEQTERVATTKAPRPPSPVRRSSGKDSSSLDDDLPYKEWERRRNQQLKARQG